LPGYDQRNAGGVPSAVLAATGLLALGDMVIKMPIFFGVNGRQYLLRTYSGVSRRMHSANFIKLKILL